MAIFSVVLADRVADVLLAIDSLGLHRGKLPVIPERL
jgi:hypothetical protein